MDELSEMGYSHEWKVQVLTSAMKGYMRVIRKVQEGSTSRNREGYTTRMNRRFKKLCGKRDWYRMEEEEDDEVQGCTQYRRATLSARELKKRRIETVAFIPYTEDSQFKKVCGAFGDISGQ